MVFIQRRKTKTPLFFKPFPYVMNQEDFPAKSSLTRIKIKKTTSGKVADRLTESLKG